jgi:predicted AAA+ superfamily ATPase
MRDRFISARIAATKKSILLLGPRQVGKSTLCQSLNVDFSLNLADEELFLA